ncbi:hypothetical protein Tco_0018565 [Tanacetum coccineum]
MQLMVHIHMTVSSPNKRYDLMDANKKVDLEHVQFLAYTEGRRSKYRLRFMLDKKELTLTLDDFRQIFHLPQATANNHNAFVPLPSFSDMVPFYKQVLDYNGIKELKSSAPRRSTVIRLRLPKRRSISLTPLAPVPTVAKVDEMILQDTLQVSLAEPKSHEEREARENVALVAEHLASKEVEKMVDDSSIPRNDESNIPGTRIEPWSDKESSEVEITKEKEVEISQEMKEEITNIIILVNVTDEDEEINDEVYELKRREKENTVEESRNSPILTPIRSSRIHSNLARFMPRKSFDILADNLYDVMVESLPEIVDKYVKKQVMQKKAKEDTERLISKAILHELDASVQNYMFGHILFVHLAQSQTSSVPEQQYQLYLAMKADPQLQQCRIDIP